MTSKLSLDEKITIKGILRSYNSLWLCYLVGKEDSFYFFLLRQYVSLRDLTRYYKGLI